MNKFTNFFVLFLLFLSLSACNLPTAQNSAVSEEPTAAAPTLTEFPPSPLPSQTATQTSEPTLEPSYTPLPPVDNPPPTPVPPSENWIHYTDPQSPISFDYPENWYVFAEGSVISIANFRLDGLQLKGYGDATIKTDIYRDPIDISAFASLEDYLSDREIKEAEDPGEVLSQESLVHQESAYQVISQLRSGLMGQEDQTYTRIFVSRENQVILLVVFSTAYPQIAQQIACSLTFP